MHRLWEPLEAWTRDFFEVIAENEGKKPKGVYYWNTGLPADPKEAESSIKASWLPDPSLEKGWLEIHAE